MSTMVQMPVRVKPPPAETGETISPGCASFEIATPLNGARMTVSSRSVCCERRPALGDVDLLLRVARCAPSSESTSACAVSTSALADDASPCSSC